MLRLERKKEKKMSYIDSKSVQHTFGPGEHKLRSGNYKVRRTIANFTLGMIPLGIINSLVPCAGSVRVRVPVLLL